MTKENTFPKSEHLCGEIRITELYTKGDAFISFPLRVVYLKQPLKDQEAVSVLVSVPKKRFKRAVKRNKLKRLIREAYRLNKHLLIDVVKEKNLQLHIAFNYVSNDELDFATIDKKMKQALGKVVEKL